MKFLFQLFLIFLLGWMVWRVIRPSPRREDPEATNIPAHARTESVTACDWCGLYVPESEMVRNDRGENYCSQAHLILAREKNRQKNKV